MLLLFSLNQYYKLAILILLSCAGQFVQAQESNIGLLESLEKIIEIDRERYQSLAKKISENPQIFESLSQAENFLIDPILLQSIFVHTDKRFLFLASLSDCHFYHVLDADLLTSAGGKVDAVMARMILNKQTQESASIPIEDFLNKVYESRCIENKKQQSLFAPDHIKAEIAKMDFKTPQTELECLKIHGEWIKKSSLPYLCGEQKIIENARMANAQLSSTNDLSKKERLLDIVREGKLKSQNFKDNQIQYLDNLCESILRPEKFCQTYVNQSFWNEILLGSYPSYYLSLKCLQKYPNFITNEKNLEKCAQELGQSNQSCIQISNHDFPALYPPAGCQIQEKALKKARLNSDYKDCPSKVFNEGLTNLGRLYAHFTKMHESPDHNKCGSLLPLKIFQMLKEQDMIEKWTYKVCFYNKIEEAQECIPTVMGNDPENEYAENNVISNLLFRIKGIPKKTKCRVISNEEYNPLRLEYKNGCFVIYDAELCTYLSCPKKVLYNNTEIKEIEYKGKLAYDYFSNTFANTEYTFIKLLAKALSLKGETIEHYTKLNNWLDSDKTAVAHGIGCAGDLLPDFFTKRTINQCRPLHFIIESAFEESGQKYLVTRLSVDDLQSPRILPWSLVFSAIKNYQALQPLKKWTLHGLKK